MKVAALTMLASLLMIVPAAFPQSQSNWKVQNSNRAQEMVNRRVERLAIIFNLTPEQKNEATTYFMSAYDADHDVAMQLRSARKTLENDINAKATQAKLTADATTIGQDQGEILANNAYARTRFLSILNPQEQNKYEKLEASLMGEFHPGPGGMAPGVIYR